MLKKILVVLATVMLLPVCAIAKDFERAYDSGTVWSIGYVETKPGHFNDYVKDLNNVWRRYLDAQKKDGDVVSYRMMNVTFTRDNEPDLILMVEYKNWAAFDRGNDYFEKLAKKLQGSVKSAQTSNINREELRTLRGGLVAQEIVFR